VLYEFSEAESFSGEGELGFQDGPGGQVGGGGVEAVEVPGVEAGEVLDCAEELVAADWREGWGVSELS